MEPVEYARLIRRRWRVVAACFLVSVVVVWVVTPEKPATRLPEFVAEHTLVRDSQSGGDQQAPATVSLFMKTGEVPKRVAKRVGYAGPPGLLSRRIGVVVDDQVGTLTVKARGNGRRAAAELANAFAEETLGFLGERAAQAREKSNADLVAKVTQHQAAIADLDRQIGEATSAGRPPALLVAQRDARIRQYSADFELQQKQADQPPPTAGYLTLEAATPELATPKSAGFGVPASRSGRTAGAGLLGLLLGVVVVLLVERVDPRIHLRAAAERAFHLPGRRGAVRLPAPAVRGGHAHRTRLGGGGGLPGRACRPPAHAGSSAGRARPVPTAPPPPGTGPSDRGVGGQHRGSYRAGGRAVPRRQRRRAPLGRCEPQVVPVTSPAPSEGKTVTVANLAASFAETGRSVLVLGCDFRRPSIHEHLGVRQAWGLTDVLAGGPGGPKLADVVKPSIIPGVRIATNGSPLDNFGKLAAAGRQLVADARALADIVLIDTAPLLVAHEATELLPSADTAVVLCRSGQTTKEDAARARELLTRIGALVAGVVLVGAPEGETSYSTYYYIEPKGHRRRLFPWLFGRTSSPDRSPTEEDRAAQAQRKRAII